MRERISKRLPQPLYEQTARPGEWSRLTEASERSIAAHHHAVEDQLQTAIIAGMGPDDFNDDTDNGQSNVKN